MMISITLRGNNNKRCAFCKYWYDPTNQYIKPKTPTLGMWQYESSAKSMCLAKNNQMSASHQCPKFENKIG